MKYLELVLKASLIVFMLGSLGGMGLELPLSKAMAALRNGRFLMLALSLGFVFCPGLAYLLTIIMPLESPYAMGLLLLGMAPSAPFMPLVVRRAGGDLAYTAAFMLIAAIATVVLMPVLAPILITGLKADFWVIARPLLLFVLAPLVAGTTVRGVNVGLAFWLCPFVRRCTNVATVIMLVIIAMIYGKEFLGLVGTFAIATQVLFVVGATLAAFWFSASLDQGQRSVLTVGMCTRNIGAAFAPLIAIRADSRAIIMVAFAVPVTVLVSFGAAHWFARRAATGPEVARAPKSDAANANR